MPVPTLRLTMADALVRYLAAQSILPTSARGERAVPLFGGVFAIFGHGNVAGIGAALHAHRDRLPTLRAHNEQAMAHAAIAYAKAHARRRMMACTTSIGPGATNLVTAAATAYVNRLPLLLLPGDIFANRAPDPVLQQIDAPHDGMVSANDTLRPVSRYFDRILRPEQLLASLPAALRVLLDPAECGPATIALPQDVQTEAFDWPASFFARRVHVIRRPPPDEQQLDAAATLLRAAKRPLVIAGGGVKYSLAEVALARIASERGLPVSETQAGKGSLAWDHPANAGAIGVSGAASANALAARADVILAVGTRLADFATGSRALFPQARVIQLNTGAFDAARNGAVPLVADAAVGLAALDAALGRWRVPSSWADRARRGTQAWWRAARRATRATSGPPTDAQVLGAVNEFFLQRDGGKQSMVVCAAGGLPGELHKLWRAADATGYHLEYGYSCMGYEIAGGLGAKLAQPQREVCVLVGDGSYLMMNSEIATSIALGAKLVIVVLDNRGFGCIERLQRDTGNASFNNLLEDSAPAIDFAAHAASLGAQAVTIDDLTQLTDALQNAVRARNTAVIVIRTDPSRGTAQGGAWWDVPVNEVVHTVAQRKARGAYVQAKSKRQ